MTNTRSRERRKRQLAAKKNGQRIAIARTLGQKYTIQGAPRDGNKPDPRIHRFFSPTLEMRKLQEAYR